MEITKAVGYGPRSIVQFKLGDTLWIATADEKSSRVSFFQISDSNGIVQDKETIRDNTLLTKGLEFNPVLVAHFQAANGTHWLTAADQKNRVSTFQIADSNGDVLHQSTLVSLIPLTEDFSDQEFMPMSAVEFQAGDKTWWNATADRESNCVSLSQIAKPIWKRLRF